MKSKTKWLFLSFLLLLLFGAVGLFWQYHTSPHFLRSISLVNSEERIKKAEFIHGGTQLLTSSNESLTLWDTKTGALIREMVVPEELRDRIFLLTFQVSEESQQVLGFDRRWPIIWDLQTGKLKFTLSLNAETNPTQHSSLTHVYGAQFINQGKKVIALRSDYTIIVWDTSTGKISKSISATFLKPAKPLNFCVTLQQARPEAETAEQQQILNECKLFEAFFILNPIFSQDAFLLLFPNVESHILELWNVEKAQKVCEYAFLKEEELSFSQIDSPGFLSFSADGKNLFWTRKRIQEDGFHKQALWYSTQTCQLERELNTKELSFEHIFALPNNRFLFKNFLGEETLWNSHTGKATVPFLKPRPLLWLYQAMSKWFDKELEPHPVMDAIFIDEQKKEALIFDGNTIYTWTLGNNTDFLEK